jgi:hypothetical protein
MILTDRATRRAAAVLAAWTLATVVLRATARPATLSEAEAALSAARTRVETTLGPERAAALKAIGADAQRRLGGVVRTFRSETGGVRAEMTFTQRLQLLQAQETGTEPAIVLSPDQERRIAAKVTILADRCGPVVTEAARQAAALVRDEDRSTLERTRRELEARLRQTLAAASHTPPSAVAAGLEPLLASYDASDLGLFLLSTELRYDELMR